MKRKIYLVLLLMGMAAGAGLSSCKDFLEIVPKGRKIPTTLADFEALIRDEYGNANLPVSNAVLLLNDRFETAANLNYSQLAKANYNWDEAADRVRLNDADEPTYYNAYTAISNFNLIVQYAPDATEATPAQKAALVAQAKVGRVIAYYHLANYYADTYEAANAGTKLSVPLILSADIDAPHTQVTIQALYEFMLKDITEALPDLPAQAATVLHANKGAAHAMAARLYLQMGQYDQALASADLALAQNNKLYDWTAYYEQNKARLEAPNLYTRGATPMDYGYEENYIFRHGGRTYSSGEDLMRQDRAARYETGDLKFASRWKLRTVGNETYYYAMTNGYFNYGGVTTSEVYLIKAECLARKNQLSAAMDALNAVRIKRISSSVYQPVTAASIKEAVNLVQRTKQNELVMTIVPFADMRRLNKEGEYAKTLTKTEGGQALSLSSTSRLWTMPFPLGAIKNPGNGTIKQNVDK